MPERLSRSPIKLYGGLPDAAKNGLAHLGLHFISDEYTGEDADDRYAIVRLRRRSLTLDDEHDGAQVAQVRVVSVMAPRSAQGQADLAKLHQEVESELGGQGLFDA
jgi:hypothetical protein